MKAFDCEQTRDALPDLVRGALDPASVDELELHLAACPDCAAERALVQRLSEALAPVPARLEESVLRGLRAAPAVRRWSAPARLAMAATLAVGLLGGVLVVQRTNQPGPGSEPDGADVAGASAVEEPLLHGSLLPELSEAELETLLKEMDS